MTKRDADHHTALSASRHDNVTVGMMARDYLDVTWRIAVPVVMLTLVGIWLDKTLGSKPWLTLLGALIGFVIAGFLIKRLLADSEAQEKNV